MTAKQTIARLIEVNKELGVSTPSYYLCEVRIIAADLKKAEKALKALKTIR